MASITLEVVLDDLKNDDLKTQERVLETALTKAGFSSFSVNEIDRDEDEEESSE